MPAHFVTSLSRGLLPRVSALLILAFLLAFSSGAAADSAPPEVEAEAAVEELVQNAESNAPAAPEKGTLKATIDAGVEKVSKVISDVLFFDISFGAFESPMIDWDTREPVLDENGQPDSQHQPLPLIVVTLVFGGVFFTFFYRFINIRAFKHSIDVIRGKFDRDEDEGEVSHFRALTSALSATVGLGNIAGVAIAVSVGGPGAVFWMLLTAVFGMSSKFSSCTLALMYRKVNADGSISGGPMYYLDLGMKEMGGFFRPLGKTLAVLFAIMAVGGALGGGNLFQANQSYAVVEYVFGFDSDFASYLYGFVAALMVGVVILGGIKRIGAATSRIVPVMAVVYVLACLFVIGVNFRQIPHAFSLIFTEAFSSQALYGGFIGVLVQGVRRAAFSNEAGMGSAAIAHAAARTKEPIREGIVGMIEPFVDTIVICTMTALVVIVSGVYDLHGAERAVLFTDTHGAQEGAVLTAVAFQQVISWFPYILAMAVVLFAYSTMISWCYYGERGWIYLLDHFGGSGLRTVIIFRIFFVFCVFIGAVANLGPVLDLSDALFLSMAFPNILGSMFLAPKVLRHLKDYWGRYQRGEMQPEQ
ncbi:MAG: alanine or glycine:cation symporter, family [Candidatus Sumerlaeota bacterium]|nr:alanine or glycine:cation symporter, family [Candidatus Sumerlaeota bacterium]